MPANMSLVPVQASQRVSDMDMQLLPRHDLFAATGSDTCGNPEEAVSITRDIQQRAQQARGPQRQAVLNQWHPINDLAAGLGRWCFVEPGSDGPAIFYPAMLENRLALAFENKRWMQEVVRLEPYLVLCWCPADYVWPYCMLCRKFCFPYNEPNSHLNSQDHRRRVDWWRSLGNEYAFALASERTHRFSFYSMTR